MKPQRLLHPHAGLVALSLVMCTGTTLGRGATPAPATTNPPAETSSFIAEMKNWQQEMSDVFHDTWNHLWQDKKTKGLNASTLATASVDLREQPDSYTIRLILPGRDLAQVGVKMKGDSVRIVAPASGQADRYEQIIQLAAAAPNAHPAIERTPDKNLLVITVPKSAPVPAGTAALPAVTPDGWDRDVLSEMRRMQREMDRAFDQDFAQFQNHPEFSQYFNQPLLGSSVDLQDKGKNYVVRAYLPDRDMNQVKVTVKGRTLQIEAQEQSNQDNKQQGTAFSQSALYSQMLTLPGPVQESKMVVDRKANMLVVTLPKAPAV